MIRAKLARKFAKNVMFDAGNLKDEEDIKAVRLIYFMIIDAILSGNEIQCINYDGRLNDKIIKFFEDLGYFPVECIINYDNTGSMTLSWEKGAKPFVL